MGRIQGSTGRALVLTASLLAGCTTWGDTPWSPRPYGSRTVVVEGEIRSVDDRHGLVVLATDRGRTTEVRVDRSTRITYGRDSYHIDALERGDVVRVWVQVNGRGEGWADRIDVRQRVQDRQRDRYRYDDDYRGRSERLQGRVGEVNLRGGYFTVEQGQGRTLVRLPDGLERDELRKVERLRRGDRVELDVRATVRGEAELIDVR
jgi:hypothetical protein